MPIENMALLSAVNLLRVSTPMLAIPLLLRAVTAADFSVYIYSVSYSAWLCIFIEYGFNISSAREIACSKDTRSVRSVVIGTESAKLILIALGAPLAVVAMSASPVFSSHPLWVAVSCTLAALNSLVPTYYFQGTERVRLVSAAEAAGSVMMLVAISVAVKQPADFRYLPWIMLTPRAIVTGLLLHTMHRACRTGGVAALTIVHGVAQLKAGFAVFLFQASVSLYTTFNVVLLGYLCSAEHVAAYATAERVIRAGLSFVGQASSALFARLNRVRAAGSERFDILRRASVAYYAVGGCAGLVFVRQLAPRIAYMLSAEHLHEVTSLLTIMSWLVPAICLSNVMGVQYLLLERREKLFNVIVFTSSLLNVAVAPSIVRAHGVQGMAWLWAAIEWLVVLAIAICLSVPPRRVRTHSKHYV